MKFWIGIDPGLNGAFAVLDDDGGLISAVDSPRIAGTSGPADVGMMLEMLHAVQSNLGPEDDVFAVLEEVPVRISGPGGRDPRGNLGLINSGRNEAYWHALLTACAIPHETVLPTRWKAAMGLTSDKKLSREKALNLWPSQRALFHRTKDEGRAEAALIGEYARRHIG